MRQQLNVLYIPSFPQEQSLCRNKFGQGVNETALVLNYLIVKSKLIVYSSFSSISSPSCTKLDFRLSSGKVTIIAVSTDLVLIHSRLQDSDFDQVVTQLDKSIRRFLVNSGSTVERAVGLWTPYRVPASLTGNIH